MAPATRIRSINWLISSLLAPLLTDELGSTTAVQLFAPYGSSRYSQGSMPTTYNFTGQRLDSETGLLYYGARYYDPLSGRFTQADLVQNNAAGMDPYAYVGENPENRTDPTGEMYAPPPGAQPLGNPPPSNNTGNSTPSTNWNTNLSSCGGYNQVDCVSAAWQTQTSYSGYVESYTTTPVISSGPIACFGYCTASLTTNSVTLRTRSLLYFTGVTPSEGCFTLLSCLAHNQGGEEGERPSDDSQALGLDDGEGFCSFTATTPVRTEQGEQPIAHLVIGEKVLAYNPKTHKMELQPIVHVWVHSDHDLVDLTLTILHRHGQKVVRTNEVIHTNKKHPFLTKERGFLAVGQIKLGMHLLQADGSYGVVTGWKVVPGTQVMYNLEVAQDHTFTVGSGEWVVHNCGGGSDAPEGWEKGEEYPPDPLDDPNAAHPQTFTSSTGMEASFYPDTGNLQVGWMTKATQLLGLRSLVNWLGDSVQTISGSISDEFYRDFFQGREDNAMQRLNDMASSIGFGNGDLQLENNPMKSIPRAWVIFSRIRQDN